MSIASQQPPDFRSALNEVAAAQGEKLVLIQEVYGRETFFSFGHQGLGDDAGRVIAATTDVRGPDLRTGPGDGPDQRTGPLPAQTCGGYGDWQCGHGHCGGVFGVERDHPSRGFSLDGSGGG